MFDIKQVKFPNIPGWIINNKQYYRVARKYMAFIMWFSDIISPAINMLIRKRKHPTEIRNILIIRLEQLGDVIVTTPFFRELKNNIPNARLHILTREANKPLFELIKYTDNLIFLNTPWLQRNDAESLFPIFKFIFHNLKKFDMVIDLHPHPANLLIARLVGNYTVAYGIKGFSFLIDKSIYWDFNIEKHISERYIDILYELNFKIENKKQELFLSKDIENSVYRKLYEIVGRDTWEKTRYKILLHPISGRSEKNLPWQKWKKLINTLLLKGTGEKNTIILIGGSDADNSVINSALNEILDSGKLFNIAGALDLKEYIHLISIVDAIYSTDTFVVHVASALRKNLTTFFTVTSEAEWGYYPNESKEK